MDLVSQQQSLLSVDRLTIPASLGIYNTLLKCISLHFKETWEQNIWALVVLFLSNKK